MIYLSIIVWRACLSATGGRALPKVGQESIGKAEEANWELLQSDLAKQFRTRSDVFFEDYPQSDILAYMEDALADDEEEEHVTKDGREYMFVGLKTVIDCLCGI